MFFRRKICLIIFISIIGCKDSPDTIQIDFVNNTAYYSESKVELNPNCNYYNFIETNYPNYRIKEIDNEELWFYNFKKKIKSNSAGDFYLLEIFILEKRPNKKLHIGVKYFKSFERRLNRIANTSRGTNEIKSLTNLIKNCNG